MRQTVGRQVDAGLVGPELDIEQRRVGNRERAGDIVLTLPLSISPKPLTAISRPRARTASKADSSGVKVDVVKIRAKPCMWIVPTA
jgi:hypothetical protein